MRTAPEVAGDVAAELRNAVRNDLTGFTGRVSLAYHGFDGAADGARGTMTVDPLAPMPAASLIKLPILACYLSEVAAGRIDPSERVELRSEARVGGDGVLRYLAEGLAPTLSDLAWLMTIVSDNVATNLLLDRLGEDTVRRWIHEAGMSGTSLVGGLQLPAERRNARQRAGERNATTAADVAGMLVRLARGELLPDPQRETMLSMLRAQQQTSGTGFWLPIDPDVPDASGRRAILASKAGALAGAAHDAALVHDASGTALFALVVLTSDAHDRAEHWRQEGLERIRLVARSVWRAATAEAA